MGNISFVLNSGTTNTGGVSNMVTVSNNEYYYNDATAIAEKFRVAKTWTQLAAARLGMELPVQAAVHQEHAKMNINNRNNRSPHLRDRKSVV